MLTKTLSFLCLLHTASDNSYNAVCVHNFSLASCEILYIITISYTVLTLIINLHNQYSKPVRLYHALLKLRHWKKHCIQWAYPESLSWFVENRAGRHTALWGSISKYPSSNHIVYRRKLLISLVVSLWGRLHSPIHFTLDLWAACSRWIRAAVIWWRPKPSTRGYLSVLPLLWLPKPSTALSHMIYGKRAFFTMHR